MVHRDVKPQNLLKRSDGRIKVADLGVAFRPETVAESERGLIAGTFPYLAPEVLSSGTEYGPASDVYALGVTLYELWTGVCPFARGSIGEMLGAITQHRLDPIERARPGLPPALGRLVHEMMAPDPSARVATSGEVVARLAGTEAAASLRAPVATTSEQRTIGPWLLSEEIYKSLNWRGFVAHHRRTGKSARLTMLEPGSELPRALILESAERASEWSHDGLVPVLDWGESGGQPYVVSAAVGQPLDRIVRDGGPLGEAEALRIVAQLAGALAFVHARGFVYQMVEPGSVRQRASGLGSALGWPMFSAPIGGDATERRTFVPAYAPPEVRYEAKFAPHTDIYGLGAVAYFVLARKSPRALDGVADRVQAIRAALPELTAPSARLLAALLDPRPDGRPSSATAVATRAGELLSHLEEEELAFAPTLIRR